MFEPAATGSGESVFVTDRLAFAAGEGRSSTPRPSSTAETHRRPTVVLIPRLLALGMAVGRRVLPPF